jgi:hypothetical protein
MGVGSFRTGETGLLEGVSRFGDIEPIALAR